MRIFLVCVIVRVVFFKKDRVRGEGILEKGDSICKVREVRIVIVILGIVNSEILLMWKMWMWEIGIGGFGVGC